MHHSATGAHLVAYVTLEHTTTADHDAEIVEEWQHLYDELYGAEVGVSEFGMDFRGWNSSYTGDPIPLEEMVEWRSATVDRIMALQPRRVLEIGAGSGLVLSQIAPQCEHYVATDMSAVAIDNLARSLEQLQIPWRDRVQLLTPARPRHRGSAAGLLRHHHPQLGRPVLPQRGISGRGHRQRHGSAGPRRGTVHRRRPQPHPAGRVPNRGRAGPHQPPPMPPRSANESSAPMLGEPELLLAPEFFTTWAADHPSAAGLDIQVKRGSADNELNRYRYDVIVHKTPAPVRSLAVRTHAGRGPNAQAWADLHTRLTSQRPAAVRITEIPRAGVITDVRIEQALAAGLPLADALAEATAAEPPDTVDPEQLHRLGETIGYHVAVTWGAQPGTLDAVFITANDAELQRIPRLTDLYLAPTEARESATHANDPRNNTKISAVRQRLSARLPDYMVPSQIVVLEEIPMTSSGKIDRKALPAPVFADTPFRAPQNQTEEILAGIYAQVLGLERVGVDESFFDLGGDSILSMQVVARARAAGLVCKPRDIFVEQTVAGLARVVEVAGGAAGPVDEGVGDVVATPIMRWLHSVDGPVDQFNQTMVVHAPAGVSQADVAVVLQALLDRHAMLRLRVDDSADDWSLTVPEAGSVDAASCLRAVDVLSDEALIAARSRLNPADGVMLSALWVPSTGQLALIIHHLAVDAVSWRILLEDLNIAWAQHHSGQPVALPPAGTSFARWASLLAEHADTAAMVEKAEAWRRVTAAPAVLPAVQPAVDTYASAGHLTATLDAETTRRLLSEVPAAFHGGIQDILLIALGLALAEFAATAAHRSALMSRVTAATRNWPPMSTCPARSAGSPSNTRWR